MAKNQFGELFSITSFGESHGTALGVVIDGCPSGVVFDNDLLLSSLARRRPGDFGNKSGKVVTQRKEQDEPEILSGIFENKTLGTPIAVIIRNKGQKSADYTEIAKKPRQGHADDVWKVKFGHVDHRGGGRSSGRETASRVMAGAIAEMVLRTSYENFNIRAYATQIGPYEIKSPSQILFSRDEIDEFVARFPSKELEPDVEKLLVSAIKEGKSYGGKVRLVIEGIPVGLGQPVFHKLKADLASAILGIGATCAVEIGDSKIQLNTEGTEYHHESQNHYGGIRGGISTGDPIVVNISFKPTSTVMDTAKKGRHDPCIIPRAIPVIEAMANLVLVDHLLWKRIDRI